MGTKQATVKTVAAVAGVSVKTVSRVINNEARVNPDTRAKVLDAIKLLNFRPRRAARQLRSSKNYNIAVIYEPPGTEFLNGVMEGVLPVCDAFDYHVLLEPIPKLEKQKYINRLISLRHVDGAILLPPESENVFLINALKSADIKCVLIESSILGISKVETDNHMGGFMMGKHLLEMGHRRFGYISLSQNRVNGNKRFLGFREALHSANIPNESVMTFQGDCSFESGYEGARKLLSKENPPTAIFAGNDYMAIGAISYANDIGVKVPDEISVAGFDNTEISRIFSPKLTTISQPLKVYGEIAADTLLATINQPEFKLKHDVLEFEFLARRSTKGKP